MIFLDDWDKVRVVETNPHLMGPLDRKVDARVRVVGEKRGVSRVECRPSLRTIESGKIHSWSCKAFDEDENVGYESDDVLHVSLKGGSGRFERSWYRGVFTPNKGLCRIYDAEFLNGDQGKYLECE